MVGVSTVARDLSLPKAVAHRILKELTANQFVTFDEGTRRYRLGPGALVAGSSSKAILAALPDAEVSEYLSTHELVSMTPATITSVEQLWEDLRAVRGQGYAVSRGERQAGAASVAAAIRLASGEVYGSLSLCGPQDRFSARLLAEYGDLVADAARQVSAELGYQPAP
ncbi:IclR family transcriptional regulator [Micromonospora sp. NPDC049900]